MKKLTVLLTVAALLFSLMGGSALATGGNESSAESARPPAPTVGTPASGDGKTEVWLNGGLRALDATFEITYASNSIIEYSSAFLRLGCQTNTSLTADTITNYFEVQRWENGSWVFYSSTSYSLSDASSYLCYWYKSVAHGYYYRIKTVHSAWRGAEYDTYLLYGNYIYVS